MKQQKVRLRAVEPSDVELMYPVENDISLWESGTTTAPVSRHALQEWIDRSAGDIFIDRQLRLMAVSGKGETVGMVDLTSFEPAHLRAEVGIIILEAYRGQGYGFAALEALCAYARDILHLHQLYALVTETNDPSLNLFFHAGFQHAGTLRDWVNRGDKYENVEVWQTFL